MFSFFSCILERIVIKLFIISYNLNINKSLVSELNHQLTTYKDFLYGFAHLYIQSLFLSPYQFLKFIPV